MMSWPLPEMVACMPWVGKPWLTGERIKPSESGSVWGTSAVSANELLGSGIQASVTVKRRDSFQEVKGGGQTRLGANRSGWIEAAGVRDNLQEFTHHRVGHRERVIRPWLGSQDGCGGGMFDVSLHGGLHHGVRVQPCHFRPHISSAISADEMFGVSTFPPRNGGTSKGLKNFGFTFPAGTSLARGWECSVMIISWPSATCRSQSEKWAAASWAYTVFDVRPKLFVAGEDVEHPAGWDCSRESLRGDESERCPGQTVEGIGA